MPGILSPILGNRALPFTAPKSSFNPITHVEVVAEEIDIASVAIATTSAITTPSFAKSASLGMRPRSLQAGMFSAQPSGFVAQPSTFTILPTDDTGVDVDTSFGGGVSGGEPEETGGDFGAEVPAAGGGSTGIVVGVPSGTGAQVSPTLLDAYMTPGVQPFHEGPAAQPDTAQTFVIPAEGAQADLLMGQGAVAIPVSVREVVGIVGAAVFSLLNTGRRPLPIDAEVYGRVGSVEIFVARVKKTLPAHGVPVRIRAAFQLEGDAAKDFYDALMAEYGETSKATLICDVVVKWAIFKHKVSDARPVDVKSETPL